MEENIGENLDDLGFGDDFLETTPKIIVLQKALKRIKTSHQLSKTIYKHISDKGLVSKMYEKIIKTQ